MNWSRVLDPRRYVGLAPQQTREFLRKHVQPVLKSLARQAAQAERVQV